MPRILVVQGQRRLRDVGRLIGALINEYFARQAGLFEGLCRLLPSHLLISALATLVCATIAAATAAYRATRIEPSSGLREL